MSGIAYFFCCLGLLIAGYAVYGVVAEKIFGVDRSRCIIFEDSASGVAAALASGCQAFCVRKGAAL